MNCCWIIILLLLCNNNNGNDWCCNKVCPRRDDKDYHKCAKEKDSDYDSRANISGNCGCENDFIQPRGFFGGGTCGCENKTE